MKWSRNKLAHYQLKTPEYLISKNQQNIMQKVVKQAFKTAVIPESEHAYCLAYTACGHISGM